MLQQTTVAAVRDYFERFTADGQLFRILAAADDADVMGEWAGLGYYARARNSVEMRARRGGSARWNLSG